MRGLVWAKAWRLGQRAGVAMIVAAAALSAVARSGNPDVELRRRAASPNVRAIVQHVLKSADNQGRPWAVVDKQRARLFVFAADGHLAGATPALLGLARGDFSAPGVGRKAASYIPPDERTTPAGRFMSRPGRNLKGEAVIWVDYATAVAIHRLRPAPAYQRRAQRLASVTADDNRISLGCVVVSGKFYDRVVAPLLGQAFGVVYVLPETGDWTSLFDAAATL